MRKLRAFIAALGISAPLLAAPSGPPAGNYITNVSTIPTSPAFSVSSGTFSTQVSMPFLTPGQCTTTNSSGKVIGTACGSGAASVAFTTGSLSGFTRAISSPTAVVNFDSSTFVMSLAGAATAFTQLNPSSVTLQGNNLSASYLTTSSATATYLQVSSATANFVTQSSVTATYFNKSGILPVANGGTGTSSPGLSAGTNMGSITGSWPNQTINASSTLVTSTASVTSGHCAQFSAAAGIIDAGASCGTGGGGGSGIVSPGTFTWTNNYGVAVTTLQAKGPTPWIDVTAYGADPTGTNDSASAVQTALNQVTSNGLQIYFPLGTYKFNSGLVYSSTYPIRITGQGGIGASGPGTGVPRLAGVYLEAGVSSMTILTMGTTNTNNYSGGVIENIAFKDISTGNTAAGGLHLINESYLQMNGVGFEQFQDSAIAPPAAPVLYGAGSGGNLGTATYYAAVSYVTVSGETQPSPASSGIAVTGPTGSFVVTSPAASGNATCYNVYAANVSTINSMKMANRGLTATCIPIGSDYTVTVASGAQPLVFNESGAYGIKIEGTDNLQGYQTGYSNQDVLNAPFGRRNFSNIVLSRESSYVQIIGGNLNFGSMTSGYGLIVNRSPAFINNMHSENGTGTITHFAIAGYDGIASFSCDAINTNATCLDMEYAYGWKVTELCAANSGSPTGVNFGNGSNYNQISMLDNYTCSAAGYTGSLATNSFFRNVGKNLYDFGSTPIQMEGTLTVSTMTVSSSTIQNLTVNGSCIGCGTGGTGTSVYPATATAVFPFGSTMTVTDGAAFPLTLNNSNNAGLYFVGMTYSFAGAPWSYWIQSDANTLCSDLSTTCGKNPISFGSSSLNTANLFEIGTDGHLSVGAYAASPSTLTVAGSVLIGSGWGAYTPTTGPQDGLRVEGGIITSSGITVSGNIKLGDNTVIASTSSFTQRADAVRFTFGDGNNSAPLTAGTTAWYHLSSSATITSASLDCFSGTDTFSVIVSTSSTNSSAALTQICASDCPALSSSATSNDTTLTGWSTSLSQDGYIAAWLNSAPPSCTYAVLTLRYQ